jgi:hypothetical protein
MAKCKHQNVDHCGPGARFAGAQHAVEHIVCLDCLELLALGPAKIDGKHAAAVSIEVAAIAAAAAHANRYPPHTRPQGDCMACGWDLAEFSDDYQPETTAHVVGWLARQIATHEGVP